MCDFSLLISCRIYLSIKSVHFLAKFSHVMFDMDPSLRCLTVQRRKEHKTKFHFTETRMHSSRMCAGGSLTVCLGVLLGRGVPPSKVSPSQGGLFGRGVSLAGGSPWQGGLLGRGLSPWQGGLLGRGVPPSGGVSFLGGLLGRGSTWQGVASQHAHPL